MKKSNASHLQIQKRTISKLHSMSAKGGTGSTNIPFTLNELDSNCVCHTNAHLCLLTIPHCTT